MQHDFKFNCAVGRNWLINILRENEDVTIGFTKTNGESRTMHCTLHKDIVVPYEKKTDRARETNDDVLAVWDLEKDAWRSFRLDSITSVNFTME